MRYVMENCAPGGVNVRDNNEMSPFHLACEGGYLDVVVWTCGGCQTVPRLSVPAVFDYCVCQLWFIAVFDSCLCQLSLTAVFECCV